MFLAMLLLSQITVVHPSAQVEKPVAHIVATTQSTTQPVTVNVNLPAAVPASQPSDAQPSKSLYDSWEDTEVAKIFSGKKTLTLDDVKNPIFWFSTAKDLVITVLAFIPRFIGTMVFLFVFWLIYRGIRKLAIRNMKQSEVDTSIRDMLATLIKWTVMGFGVVIACNQLGIPIVAMLTGVSIIGLAVGFAAQETLANFIAGIVIFLDKPFKVGDWIQIASTYGQVKRVTFRSTRMITLDGDIVIFPNTQMLNQKLENRTTNPINRVHVAIGIAYKSSIDAARKALLDIVSNDSRICGDPAPTVVVSECADSSVNLLLRFWIRDEALEHTLQYEMLERAKKALDAAGVEIPFPHMQLFIQDTPAIIKLAGGKGKAP